MKAAAMSFMSFLPGGNGKMICDRISQVPLRLALSPSLKGTGPNLKLKNDSGNTRSHSLNNRINAASSRFSYTTQERVNSVTEGLGCSFPVSSADFWLC